MTFQKLGAGLQDRINDLEALAMETASFYITLDNDGATETLISHGPIEVFAIRLLTERFEGRGRLMPARTKRLSFNTH